MHFLLLKTFFPPPFSFSRFEIHKSYGAVALCNLLATLYIYFLDPNNNRINSCAHFDVPFLPSPRVSFLEIKIGGKSTLWVYFVFAFTSLFLALYFGCYGLRKKSTEIVRIPKIIWGAFYFSSLYIVFFLLWHKWTYRISTDFFVCIFLPC